jgi:ABC-type nickel/cobalt efflux system permease component RcnA
MRHTYEKPISTRLLLSAVFALAFFFWVSYQSHMPHDDHHADHVEEAHGDSHDEHGEDHGHDHDHAGGHSH